MLQYQKNGIFKRGCGSKRADIFSDDDDGDDGDDDYSERNIKE
jgi:hypothetical protein